MKWVLPLAALALASCQVEERFWITAEGADRLQFGAIYQHMNHVGGVSVLRYAQNAKDFAASAAKEEAEKRGRGLLAISLTDGKISHSLAGIYSFEMTGTMHLGEAGAPISITDTSNLMPSAETLARSNLQQQMILSPATAIVSSAIHPSETSRTLKR